MSEAKLPMWALAGLGATQIIGYGTLYYCLSILVPDIAPDLVPLRQQLMAMVNRPVNIQATRDIVMYLRGELIGQPYHTLIEKPTRE